MWIINWLPQWVFYVVLITSGVLAVGASIFNARAMQLISLLIACSVCFYIGGTETEHKWQARVSEMQQKVALAEQKSAETNTKIITKIQTKIKLVKEVTNADTVYITKYVAQDLDRECKLTGATILLHNSASQGEVPTSAPSAAGTATEVKASELITTVTENYGTYYELVERLRGWQDWYYKQKKIFEE
jgi:hypothetical protein